MTLAIVAAVLIVAATFFNVVAVIGFHRLPDVYTRMHAAGMAATFGAVFLLIMAPLVMHVGIAKVVLLAALLLIAAPVASHTIASAALRAREPQQPPSGSPPPPDALHD